jgi:hypothetical protein
VNKTTYPKPLNTGTQKMQGNAKFAYKSCIRKNIFLIKTI